MRSKSTQAFTLVELLVSIAIIGILASLLLPSLSKSKTQARTAQCQGNLRQLQLCFQLYVSDSDDCMPPNNSIFIIGGGAPVPGISWLPDMDARTEYDPSNIVDGVLFQYNRSLAIYHCPSDHSTLETATGIKLPQPRWRSYNMSQSVNGYPDYPGYDPMLFYYIPMWKKSTEITRPTERFVFIDENEDSIEDAEFGSPPRGSPYYWQNVWWDMPSDRHDRGANLSFTDGHVERWQWRVRKEFILFVQPVPPAEMPDYQRIQNAMKQPRE